MQVHSLVLPDGTVLQSLRPEDFPRSFMVANAVGVQYPRHEVMAWISSMTEPYDGRNTYWHPYKTHFGEVCLAEWARGAFGYAAYIERSRNPELVVPDPTRIDPTEWSGRLALVPFSELTLSDSVRTAFEVAVDQYSPDGMFGGATVELWTKVRHAQSRGEFVSEPRKIKKLMAKIKAYESADERY